MARANLKVHKVSSPEKLGTQSTEVQLDAGV